MRSARSRRQVLGGAIGGIGAAMLGRGLSNGVHEEGLAPAARAQGASVSIEDFEFVPRVLAVPVGTEVIWTQNGDFDHNVTAFDSSFVSADLVTGETFAHIFATAGVFNYVCTIHGVPMDGTIIVEEAQTPAKLYVRPNLMTMTPAAQADYLQTYAEGIAAMKARDEETGTPEVFRTSWLYQAQMHGVTPEVRDELGAAELAKRAWATCQHHQWFFFPWHRMYLYWWEKILRASIPDPAKRENFALAYWDYFPAAQRVLPDQFFTPAAESNALWVEPRGPFVNGDSELPAEFEFIFDHRPAMTHMNFSHPAGGISFGGQIFPVAHQGPDGGQLENVTHDMVHGYVGGLMGNPNTSAIDPIFLLHHVNIDRLWSRWLDQPLAANPSETEPTDAPWYAADFLFFNEAGGEEHMTGADILSSACQLDYRYEDDDPNPICEPLEAAGTPVAVPAIVPQPEVVARGESKIELGAERTTVPLELGEATASVLEASAAAPEATGQVPTVVLTLQDVRGTGVPDVSNAVYLNLPDGVEPDPRGPYFVGLISLFGRQPDNLEHTHEAPTQSFDITENLRALQAGGELPEKLVLTFVPFSFGAAAEGTPQPEAVQGPWVTVAGYTVAVQ